MRSILKSSLLLLCTVSFLAGLRTASASSEARKSEKSPSVPSVPTSSRPTVFVFNDENGLPQNSINTLIFDRKGYLWVGTQDGAAFYNGRAWVVVNLPNQSVSNHILTMFSASDGGLWFGSQGGGAAQLKDGNWTTYTKSSGLPDDTVLCFTEAPSPDGRPVIWVGTLGGPARIRDGSAQPAFGNDSGLTNASVNALLPTKDGDGTPILLLGTTQGLVTWPLSGDGRERVRKTELPKSDVRVLLETKSSDGTAVLWVGTRGTGLFRRLSGQWAEFSAKTAGLPSDTVQSLIETESNGAPLLWIGTEGGLASFQGERLTVHDTKSFGFSNTSILSLNAVRKTEGPSTLWIGTDGDGLVRLCDGHWTTYDTRNSGLTNDLVFSFAESKSDDGTPVLWIGTDGGGLARLEQGRWTVFNTKNSGLPDDTVNYILPFRESDGTLTIWVGTSGGIAKFSKNRWTTFTSKNSGLPDDLVFMMLIRSENGSPALWIGTNGGLARFHNEQWTKYSTSDSPLPSNAVLSLLETKDPNGESTLWIGTENGLATLRDGDWKIYRGEASGLPNDGINCLQETVSPDGTRFLWIGTNNGAAGFPLPFGSAKPTLFSDTTNPRLLNKIVYQIRQDTWKRLYLFTNKGISRVRLPNPDIKVWDASVYTFTTDDGLPSNECNSGASMIDGQGRIWGGTVKGAVMFDPDKEIPDFTPKPLFVEHVLLDSQPVAANSSLLSDLAHNQNNLAFDFALLSYFRQADTRYRTQLVGLEDAPSDWSEDHKKEYTTLPKGRYVFRVWAADYAGNTSGPVEIAFTIRPAPWHTWWAYLAYALSLGGGGYVAVQFRLKSLRKRNELLEAKVERRTRALAEKNVELDHKNVELAEKIDELARKNDELIKSKEDLIQSHKQAERIFSALSDALPGTVLDGKYRLDDKIGAGGFGAVYRGTHLAMRRGVAIKVFRPAGGNATFDGLERFQMEAVSTCRVNHPNAVAVLDSGISTNGIAYLVMELLNGRALSAELNLVGRFSPARCLDIILPVCDVLDKAHTSGIVHRDIKPDNIFLHRSEFGETVKVVDFGIAKLMGETQDLELQNLTGTGAIIGTPSYMAPERLNSKPYDGRADVYSVGVMMYEMLTGRVPFESQEGFLGLIMQHLLKEPRPPRELVPEIPAELESIVLWTLRKNPADRPTAQALAKAVASIAGINYKPLERTGEYDFARGRRTTDELAGRIDQNADTILGHVATGGHALEARNTGDYSTVEDASISDLETVQLNAGEIGGRIGNAAITGEYVVGQSAQTEDVSISALPTMEINAAALAGDKRAVDSTETEDISISAMNTVEIKFMGSADLSKLENEDTQPPK